MKNILIIGSGGREHALAWKCAQSTKVKNVYVAPGNGGTAAEPKVTNIPLDILDFPKLIAFAKLNAIDLTIVGPEQPLAAGIVDAFQQENLACFGPSQKAAQLEASKVFSKQFMKKYQIPTASYASFTVAETAKKYLRTQSLPIVIKADGLAAGKGVVIARELSEADAAIDSMLNQHIFGKAGHEIVIEEFLEGEEASFIVVVDGKHVIPLASSQDYKTRDNNNKGPNTGGMGAYSPAPIVTSELEQEIMQTIVGPTLAGLQNEGIPYTGFLYVGLMIDSNNKPKVLEYNCRLGDPETQPLMMRLQSDLYELCDAAVKQQLDRYSIAWDQRSALGIILAAGGYPGDYQKGDIIKGIPAINGNSQKVFHAGTQLIDNQFKTNGGRVLCVSALGSTILEAQHDAYQLARQIHWKGMFYRTDIGNRATMKLQ